jgi:hypothetical protein
MLLYVLPLMVALAGQVAAARPAPPLYDPAADAKKLIEAAIKSANVDDIRVLINWGANDDPASVRFGQVLKTPEVTRTRYAADEYRIVNVDVGHLDKNLDLARTYGATLSSGALPALTVLDQKGKIVAQARATDFISTSDPAAFDPNKVAAFLTKNQALAPDALPLFEAAVKQANQDGKYVFVWFSAPW